MGNIHLTRFIFCIACSLPFVGEIAALGKDTTLEEEIKEACERKEEQERQKNNNSVLREMEKEEEKEEENTDKINNTEPPSPGPETTRLNEELSINNNSYNPTLPENEIIETPSIDHNEKVLIVSVISLFIAAAALEVCSHTITQACEYGLEQTGKLIQYTKNKLFPNHHAKKLKVIARSSKQSEHWT